MSQPDGMPLTIGIFGRHFHYAEPVILQKLPVFCRRQADMIKGFAFKEARSVKMLEWLNNQSPFNV